MNRALLICVCAGALGLAGWGERSLRVETIIQAASGTPAAYEHGVPHLPRLRVSSVVHVGAVRGLSGGSTGPGVTPAGGGGSINGSAPNGAIQNPPGLTAPSSVTNPGASPVSPLSAPPASGAPAGPGGVNAPGGPNGGAGFTAPGAVGAPAAGAGAAGGGK